MNSFSNSPLNGKVLKVLAIARISTRNQPPESLERQEHLVRRWLDQNYGDNYDLTMMSIQESGDVGSQGLLREQAITENKEIPK